MSDAQGGAVDSANATLQNDQTGFKRSVVTDATGTYQFLQVPPGTYVLVIEKPGFSVSTQKDVQLLVNTPATLNVALQLATVTTSVNVEAEVVTINTVDAAIGNAFNQTQVRQLPLQTRNVVELLSLQPGVTRRVKCWVRGAIRTTSRSTASTPTTTRTPVWAYWAATRSWRCQA